MKLKLSLFFAGMLFTSFTVFAQPKIAAYPGTVLDLEDL
jgi:hypothetical protein